MVLKFYTPKNRCIFSYVQYVERIFKFRSEFRHNCGWIFSFQCAIIGLQKNLTARKKKKQSRSVADRDNNSLSIESQKEDCIRYVGADCVYRLYGDNGFSGKNIVLRFSR